MTEPLYEVVSPVGDARNETRQGKKTIPSAPALQTLQGRRIGLLWTVFTNGNLLLESLGAWLTRHHPDTQWIRLMPGRNLNWGDYPDLSLPELAREMDVDAVIVTAGG